VLPPPASLVEDRLSVLRVRVGRLVLVEEEGRVGAGDEAIVKTANQ
jgi:hypothetical protein